MFTQGEYNNRENSSSLLSVFCLVVFRQKLRYLKHVVVCFGPVTSGMNYSKVAGLPLTLTHLFKVKRCKNVAVFLPAYLIVKLLTTSECH